MSELLEDVGKPISDTAPCGADIAKLDPSIAENQEWNEKYVALRGAIRKVAANCEEIVELSQSILANKSKDLRIAGHLCRGLLHQKGFTGLAEGLKGYRTLLEEYWDKGLYPLKKSARKKNVELLGNVRDSLWKDMTIKSADGKGFFIPTKPSDGEALEGIKETAEGIKAILKEKSPDGGSTLEKSAISMDNIIRAADERLRQPGVVTKKKDQDKGEKRVWRKKKDPSAEEETEVVTTDEEVSSRDTARRAPTSDMEAINAVVQAAKFLLEKSSKNVGSYRLLRSVLWYLFIPPDPDDKGKRITPLAVSPDKSRLEQLLKDEDWESLVIACEAAFVRELESGGSSFCLDIQRFLCTALEELIKKSEEKKEKEAYEVLHKVILQETAMFVERFPYITEILYSDKKTPFADKPTKNWIEASVKPIFGRDAARLVPTEQDVMAENNYSEDISQISEDFKKAEELLAKQKWGGALDLMQRGIDAEPTCKGRFQRRLDLANLCLDANQPSMARPLLEQLDEDIERFSLDQWDPSLCLQVWTCLRNCYQELLPEQEQQGSNGFYHERADKIFEKICRLDIRAVMISDQ